jgi:hypothetical protein
MCDTDPDSLHSVQKELTTGPGLRPLSTEKLECVPEDGVSVLRGAGMSLPEPWIPSTLAFIDPFDFSQVTDAGISSLDLACELANRGIPTLLLYTFKDPASQSACHTKLAETLTKTRLTGRAARFEGNLQSADAPSQWGFGILALNLASATDDIDRALRALQATYRGTTFPTGTSGEWTYRKT